MFNRFLALAAAVQVIAAQSQYGYGYGYGQGQGYGQQFPMQQMYGGNSPSCENQPFECAGRTIVCLESSCTYDCSEPGACVNTKFMTSPITEDIKINCKKLNACSGVKVISGASKTTAVTCDDHACYGMDVKCMGNNADQCKFECSNDGCAPFQASPMNMHPGAGFGSMPKLPPNKFTCAGTIKQCLLKVSPRFSFLNGEFSCALRGGKCVMECAGSSNQVSCRGAKYKCYSPYPGVCDCKDQQSRPSRGFGMGSNPFLLSPVNPSLPGIQPGFRAGGDCPALTFPKPKTTKSPKTTGSRMLNKNQGI